MIKSISYFFFNSFLSLALSISLIFISHCLVACSTLICYVILESWCVLNHDWICRFVLMWWNLRHIVRSFRNIFLDDLSIFSIRIEEARDLILLNFLRLISLDWFYIHGFSFRFYILGTIILCWDSLVSNKIWYFSLLDFIWEISCNFLLLILREWSNYFLFNEGFLFFIAFVLCNILSTEFW